MGTKLARGLYRRNGVAWVRTDPVDGRQRSTGFRDAEAANRWLADRERLAADPSYEASRRATVGEWILKTFAFKRGQSRAEGTLEMYEIKLGHVARIFGVHSSLSTITPGTLDAYIARRRDEGSVNNTIARELTCLRQMLRLARRAGVFSLGVDQVMPIGFAAKYVPVTRTLTWAKFQDLIAGTEDERQAAWICIAIATGADTSDVHRMQREDFDTERWVVKMRGTKNAARSATIPIPEPFRPLVERALPFLPLSWPRVSKALPELTTRLKIGHYSPKDLRRSACTWLVEAGVPEDAVSRWMRHRNSTMVRMIYGQMRPEALGSIIDGRTQKRDTDTRPLGEIGRRAGFKSRRLPPADLKLAEILGLARHELARRDLVRRTETLQSLNELRRARMALGALVAPEAFGPGLAACNGVAAAYRGSKAGMRRAVEQMAQALGIG
jgi:integrase